MALATSKRAGSSSQDAPRFRTKQPTSPWDLTSVDLSGKAIIGQFDCEFQRATGGPVWDIRDGTAGGQAWGRHVGTRALVHRFTFHFLAESAVDTRPNDSLETLLSMTTTARSLGRPPSVQFRVGDVVVSGFLVELPTEVPIKHWFNSKVVLEVGPFSVSLFEAPVEAPRSSSTTYYVLQPGDTFANVSAKYYGTTAYAASLALVNQGAAVGDTVRIPPRDSGLVTTQPEASVFMDSK